METAGQLAGGVFTRWWAHSPFSVFGDSLEPSAGFDALLASDFSFFSDFGGGLELAEEGRWSVE